MPAKVKGHQKVATVMREFREGTLHSGGSGRVVTSRDQAIAIAMSEQRKADKRRRH